LTPKVGVLPSRYCGSPIWFSTACRLTPQLLDRGALHLDHADLEHDLLLARDAQHVEHHLRLGDEALSDALGLVAVGALATVPVRIRFSPAAFRLDHARADDAARVSCSALMSRRRGC
jgi:hypothetical protein